MENYNELTTDKKIILGSNSIQQITQTRKWTMLLSITGLIFIGLITAVIIAAFFSESSTKSILNVLPLMIIVLIYFFPIYYLLQFSRYSKIAITNLEENVINIALKYLKLHFRFMAILIMISLFIYVIVGASILITGELSKYLY